MGTYFYRIRIIHFADRQDKIGKPVPEYDVQLEVNYFSPGSKLAVI